MGKLSSLPNIGKVVEEQLEAGGIGRGDTGCEENGITGRTKSGAQEIL